MIGSWSAPPSSEPTSDVEPPPQPVVRDADGRPQPAEAGRRGVEQLADRVEAAGQGRADRRQRVELAGERVEQRPAIVGERGLRGGRSRRACRRSRGTAPGRGGRRAPRARPPARCRAPPPIPTPARSREQRPGLVGLVEAAGDDDRVRRRLERLRQPLRRRERGRGGEPVADERELEQRDRAGVHRRVRVGRAGETRPGDRGARRVDEPPRDLGPGRARVGDPDPRRRDDVRTRFVGRGRLDAERRRRVAAGRARSSTRSIPNAAATSPGPLVRPRPAPPEPRASRASRSVPALAPRPPPREPRVAHRVDALERLDGADEERRAAGPSASVTMFRQSYIP